MKISLKFKDVFYKNLITEGVYDKGIFKAVILAGGPGSGKSYVSDKTLKGLGLKFVNSDSFIELLFKKRGLSLSMPPETRVQTDAAYVDAGKLSSNQLDTYVDGRLGLVIDGTGRNYERIKNTVEKLRDIGYDAKMLFVNTNLQTALKRNANRQRKVPEDYVTQTWNEVQNNIGKFQHLFGAENFMVVDNSADGINNSILTDVFKNIKKFLNHPIKNPIAKKWIDIN